VPVDVVTDQKKAKYVLKAAPVEIKTIKESKAVSQKSQVMPKKQATGMEFVLLRFRAL
jgi:hypothetical protein